MVKYADGPGTEVEISVAAAPSIVWDLVTDIELPARFSAEFQGATWFEGESPGLGSRFEGRNRHRAVGEWTTTSTVTEWKPERAFTWTVGDLDNATARWGYRLEPTDGVTRLQMWARMGPGPSGVSVAIESRPDREDEIVRRRLDEWRQNMIATVEGIKAIAEAG